MCDAFDGKPRAAPKTERMQQTVLAGVAMWSVWQPDRNLYFNSFFVASPDGNVAIDPLPISDADADDIAARGGLTWVLVTNRDHERDARAVAAKIRREPRLFGARRAVALGAGRSHDPAGRTRSPGPS